MAQNVFMASMYFLVPINKPKKSITESAFCIIECNTLFQHVSARCSYAALKDTQKFYFNASEDRTNPKERLIQTKVYALKYQPNAKNMKKEKYFLAIGLGIDKVFDGKGNNISIDNYCDANDLAMLKRAFYSDNHRPTEDSGLYYPQKEPTIFNREWLERIVSNYDKEHSSDIKFDASITDIQAVGSCTVQGIADRNQLANEFRTLYLRGTCLSYDNVLDVDADRLAYGILVGNENFVRLPDDLIADFKANSYSNCLSERLFAISNSLLFIHTHYPYINLQDHYPVKDMLDMSIRDLDERNIYELCHSLYLKEELAAIRAQVNLKSKASIVKKAADKMAYLQQFNLFNFHEADQRITTLFRGLGVEKLSCDTDKLVSTYLGNSRFSYSKKQSNWMRGLTWVTIIIGILALFTSLWHCEIRKHLEGYVYFGDIQYQRWVGYLYFVVNTLIVLGLFVFFSKLKMPFNRWFAIRLDRLMQCIHKTAIGENN